MQLAMRGNNSKTMGIISFCYFWLSGQSLNNLMQETLARKTNFSKKKIKTKSKEFLGNSLP